MPTARKIIFSTYVVPTQTDTMEETTRTQTSYQPSPGGTLGGKGTAIVDATQWADEWRSAGTTDFVWEEWTTTNWSEGHTWTEYLTISNSAHQLTTDSTDCGFLYVKNLGTAVNALVSLNGTSGNYYIIVPPGGSVCLRGTTALECNEVYVKAATSDGTNIEYVIAQLTP